MGVRYDETMMWLFRYLLLPRLPTRTAGSAGLGPGRIQQAFVFSLKEDMTEYYRLIAVLGAQLNLDSERANEGGVDGGVSGGGTEGMTLQRLFVWIQDPLERLKLMATLVAAAAQLKVGADLFATRYLTAFVVYLVVFLCFPYPCLGPVSIFFCESGQAALRIALLFVFVPAQHSPPCFFPPRG